MTAPGGPSTGRLVLRQGFWWRGIPAAFCLAMAALSVWLMFAWKHPPNPYWLPILGGSAIMWGCAVLSSLTSTYVISEKGIEHRQFGIRFWLLPAARIGLTAGDFPDSVRVFDLETRKVKANLNLRAYKAADLEAFGLLVDEIRIKAGITLEDGAEDGGEDEARPTAGAGGTSACRAVLRERLVGPSVYALLYLAMATGSGWLAVAVLERWPESVVWIAVGAGGAILFGYFALAALPKAYIVSAEGLECRRLGFRLWRLPPARIGVTRERDDPDWILVYDLEARKLKASLNINAFNASALKAFSQLLDDIRIKSGMTFKKGPEGEDKAASWRAAVNALASPFETMLLGGGVLLALTAWIQMLPAPEILARGTEVFGFVVAVFALLVLLVYALHRRAARRSKAKAG